MDIRHPLHAYVAPPSRLRSRDSFMQTVLRLQKTKQEAKAHLMTHKLLNGWKEESHQRKASLVAHDLGRATWKSLNRLRVHGTGEVQSTDESLHNRRRMQLWISADNVPPTGLCACPPVQSRRLGRSYCTPSAVACARYWQNGI